MTGSCVDYRARVSGDGRFAYEMPNPTGPDRQLPPGPDRQLPGTETQLVGTGNDRFAGVDYIARCIRDWAGTNRLPGHSR